MFLGSLFKSFGPMTLKLLLPYDELQLGTMSLRWCPWCEYENRSCR